MDNIIDKIYDAQTEIINIIPEQGIIKIAITYKDKQYIGQAQCDVKDMDFFSTRVGKNIAISKARQLILQEEQFCATEEQNYYKDRFNEEDQEEASETYYNAYVAAKERLESLDYTLKVEQNNLNKYIEGQKRALSSIRKLRNKVKDN